MLLAGAVMSAEDNVRQQCVCCEAGNFRELAANKIAQDRTKLEIMRRDVDWQFNVHY
jgi:hypothetical protein